MDTVDNLNYRPVIPGSSLWKLDTHYMLLAALAGLALGAVGRPLRPPATPEPQEQAERFAHCFYGVEVSHCIHSPALSARLA